MVWAGVHSTLKIKSRAWPESVLDFGVNYYLCAVLCSSHVCVLGWWTIVCARDVWGVQLLYVWCHKPFYAMCWTCLNLSVGWINFICLYCFKFCVGADNLLHVLKEKDHGHVIEEEEDDGGGSSEDEIISMCRNNLVQTHKQGRAFYWCMGIQLNTQNFVNKKYMYIVYNMYMYKKIENKSISKRILKS